MSKKIVLNSQERTFLGWLDFTDFELCSHEDGYGLIDRQGANLGNIESDRFNAADSVLDRMDIYYDDYLYNDLEEEAATCGTSFAENCPNDTEGWLKLFKKRDKMSPNDKKFFKVHKGDFDILALLNEGATEVNLGNVWAFCQERREVIEASKEE